MEPTLEQLQVELDRLRSRIRQVRDERVALSGKTPSRGPLIAAAERARQDRDAQISPELTDLRERLVEKVGELRYRWSEADRKRWILSRLDDERVAAVIHLSPARRAALDTLLEEEAQQRGRDRKALESHGVSVPPSSGSDRGDTEERS